MRLHGQLYVRLHTAVACSTSTNAYAIGCVCPRQRNAPGAVRWRRRRQRPRTIKSELSGSIVAICPFAAACSVGWDGTRLKAAPKHDDPDLADRGAEPDTPAGPHLAGDREHQARPYCERSPGRWRCRGRLGTSDAPQSAHSSSPTTREPQRCPSDRPHPHSQRTRGAVRQRGLQQADHRAGAKRSIATQCPNGNAAGSRVPFSGASGQTDRWIALRRAWRR